MFSRILTTKSIENYSGQIKKLKNEIETADAIVAVSYTHLDVYKRQMVY